jgi:4-amino-4-deoxy-L-arabinose transferase-like glycosyltransferase
VKSGVKHWRILFAAALVALTFSFRWPGLGKEIWNVDEAVTFTMAQQILTGDTPYRDAVDQRPPLAPYAQALVFALAGDWNLRAQHVALALMIGLTAVLLWQAARRLGDEAAGAAGALWFTLLAFVLPVVRDTMPAHTAWYLVFFSTAGFWALARAWSAGRPAWAAAAGACFGLSFLAKQPGALDFGAALVLLALAAWAHPERRRELAEHGGAALAGFAVPVALTGAYFAAKGAWADLVYYTWTYNNTLYVPEVPPLERWRTMQVPFQLAWEYHPAVVVLGVLAAAGLLARAFRGLKPASGRFDLLAWLILGWCATGLISTTLSGRGFTHYSIQLIPGLSLACGWVSARIWRAGWKWAGESGLRLAAIAVAVAAFAVWLSAPVLKRIPALDLPEPGGDEIAALVRRHTAPDERIFVWGYTPEIYALSRRLPAVRFVYNTFVTGMIPWTNLDPLKDTAYAVVPGAREQLLADWSENPPALVADGRGQRGFLKYPLENQAWLWPLIEAGYAEVATDEAARRGFWIFRRLERAEPESLPPGIPLSGEVQTEVVEALPGQSARVIARTPAGIHTLDLYLNGVLYRRLACPPDAPAYGAFFILPADWAGQPARAQVVATGPHGRMRGAELEIKPRAPRAVIGGPPLEFGDRQIAALESSTITKGPILLKPENPGHWDAHAPSRLVYPWLPGMNSLAFSYGIEQDALAREPPNHTDGVEVIVQVEDSAGRLTPVYRHHFDRTLARRAGGETTGYTPLPPGAPGRLILQMAPGPDVAAAFDWSYWRWIRADESPIALLAGGNLRAPARIEPASGVRQTEFNGRFITVADAPSVIEFAATADMDELSGGFGLLDTAWFRQKDPTPVDFSISVVGADGAEKKLFARTLRPAEAEADRGAQEFQFRLPQPIGGRLRFAARPQRDGASAPAFWSKLNVTLLRTALEFQGGPIPAHPDTEGRFGFMNSSEDGRDCVVAHAPAKIVHAWREGMGRLTAEYGLISAAYTQHETEGVVFTVEIREADGTTRELFRRHLAPMTRAEDRGAQKLSIALPRLPGGQVILRTLPPASGNLNAAWSYWREIRAEL